MGLERVHRTDSTERFGPIRLGPQDLRDIAAIFKELDSEVDLTLPTFRTQFHVQEHRTDDIKDVLAFADADTLPSLQILSGELLLSLYVGQGGTSLDKPSTPTSDADRQAVEEAAEKVRQIVRSRQLRPLERLRQRGPGKWLLASLLAVPALALGAGQPLLDLWFTRTTSQAVPAVLVWLCFVLLVLLMLRPKNLIRLRGQELPWWERRQGLVGLAGVVLAVVIPFVIFALERRQE